MTSLSWVKALLGQAPAPVPAPAPTPPLAPDAGFALGNVIGIAILALFVVLMLLALRKVTRKKSELPKGIPETEGLPAETPALKVELPPSEVEAKKRAEAEAAHAEAEALAEKRRKLAQEAKAASDEGERQKLKDEAARLKEQEEEKKREEYRAKKALDVEEKERHRREREEEARIAKEAVLEKQRAEAEAERLRKEQESARIASEAGQTLSQGLDKTRNAGFIGKLNSLFGGAPKKVDESVLAQLEEVLFTADIGVKTASNLVEAAREKVRKNELSSADKIKDAIRAEVARIVDLPKPRSLEGGGPPHAVMVVGVNGSGKTTTIGKLAAKAKADGKKVVLAAGDTFRAAAAEQLDVWSERAGAKLVKGPENGDPASVVFDGAKVAIADGADLLIADTAGRLHTAAPLMEELKKVKRVMAKALPGAPHEVLLVLDSTNGQNAIQQAKQFHEAVGVTAIALTKLDGTAKGGVIIGICDELKIPVAWVGVGERVQDLRPFDPKEFVAALFD